MSWDFKSTHSSNIYNSGNFRRNPDSDPTAFKSGINITRNSCFSFFKYYSETNLECVNFCIRLEDDFPYEDVEGSTTSVYTNAGEYSVSDISENAYVKEVFDNSSIVNAWNSIIGADKKIYSMTFTLNCLYDKEDNYFTDIILQLGDDVNSFLVANTRDILFGPVGVSVSQYASLRLGSLDQKIRDPEEGSEVYNNMRELIIANLLMNTYEFEADFKGFDWDVYIDGEDNLTSITFKPSLKNELTQDIIDILNETKLYVRPVILGDNENLPSFQISEVGDVDIFVGYYPYDGQSNTPLYPYNTIQSNLYTVYNTLQQIALKLSKHIGFYLFYKGTDGISHGIIGGQIPKSSERPQEANSIRKYGSDGISSPNPDDQSTLTYHYGQPPIDSDDYSDGRDGSKDDPNSDSIPDSSGYNTVGVLTTTYAMTPARLKALGSFLWSGSFIDNIKLLNNSPIENIVSLKAFPFDISGTDEEIVLGNVSTGVNGAKVATSYSYRTTIGSISIGKKFGSFLDYAPFTKMTIFLPFIGYKELDSNLFAGRILRVDYISDIVTGTCKAVIYADGNPVASFDGSMGIDVPISSSNRAQIEAGYISSFVDIATSPLKGATPTGIVTDAISGMVDNALNMFHTQQGTGVSPSCDAYVTRSVFIIFDRPTIVSKDYTNTDRNAFNHTKGRMCMLSRTIGSLKGFTKTTSEIDLSSIACLDAERDEIRSILSSGFFA